MKLGPRLPNDESLGYYQTTLRVEIRTCCIRRPEPSRLTHYTRIHLYDMQITVNGESREVAQGTTVAGLLDELRMTGKPVAVEVNLELVPRQQHAEHRLAESDHLEIVTLVGGG